MQLRASMALLSVGLCGFCEQQIGNYHSQMNIGKDGDRATITSAATTCYVALDLQVKGVSGKYLCDSNMYEPRTKDMDLAKRMWELEVQHQAHHLML